MGRRLDIHVHGARPRSKALDAEGAWGVRWRQASKSGAIQNKERTFGSRTERDSFVARLVDEDGFIEIVSWLDAPKSQDAGGVRIVYNKLLGGWYIVRGSSDTPIGGRFDSKEQAQAHLDRDK